MIRKTQHQNPIWMNFVLGITILFVLPCVQSIVLAQVPTILNSKVQSGDSVRFEAVPFDPVLDILGYNNNQISHPGSIDKVLAGASTAIDMKGRLQTGFAVSFAPYYILNAQNLYLRDYIVDLGTRILTNTQVSFGTAPNLNKDSSLNWGVGIKIPFLNAGDARINVLKINQLVNLSKQALEITKEYTSSNMQKLVDTSSYFSILDRLGENIEAYTNGKHTLEITVDSIRVFKKEFIEAWQKKVSSNTTLKNTQQIDSMRIDTCFEHISDGIYLLAIHKQQAAIKSLTPSWNTPYLDLNAGMVYRASGANIKESGMERFRLWLNGGGQFFVPWLQVMGQVGYCHIFTLGNDVQQQKNSMLLQAAVMLRGGNENLRFGLGGNYQTISSDFSLTNLFLLANLEVRYQTLWIVGSLSGQTVKNSADNTTSFLVTPNIGIKSTLGY